MNRKQKIITYFRALEQQAEFDHDGNAAAMFRGLWMDVDSMKPDVAFELRDTFADGSELAGRVAAAAGETHGDEPIPVPPASDDPAHDAPASNDPVTDPVPADGDPKPVDVPAGDAVGEESATDKAQDEQIAKMKERIDQLEAEKMAAKLAPENAA